MQYIVIYLVGALCYGGIELIYQGYTHWTMLLVGGASLVLIHLYDCKLRQSLWKTCIMGGVSITAIEFIVGICVNIVLKWDVWDYAGVPLNLFGQICPRNTVYWVALTLPAVYLTRIIHRGLRLIEKRRRDIALGKGL